MVLAKFAAARLDGGERRRAVDVRLAHAEQVEVGAVQDHQADGHGLLSSPITTARIATAARSAFARADADAFEPEQPLLRERAAERREASDLVAAGEDAVAGDDDGDGVARHRLPDRARRAGRAGLPGQVAIGRRLAPADAARRGVDLGVEGRDARQVQRHGGEVDPLAGHVALHVGDHRRDPRAVELRRSSWGRAASSASRSRACRPPAAGSARGPARSRPRRRRRGRYRTGNGASRPSIVRPSARARCRGRCRWCGDAARPGRPSPAR